MLERLDTRWKRAVTAMKPEDLQLQPHCFDLVITDQTMPQMTGTELTRAILQIRGDMPVILCTGFGHASQEFATREGQESLGIRELALKLRTGGNGEADPACAGSGLTPKIIHHEWHELTRIKSFSRTFFILHIIFLFWGIHPESDFQFVPIRVIRG